MLSQDAQVMSVQRLQELHAQLVRYREDMNRELDNLKLELQRLDQWIGSSVPQYWMSELRVAKRQLSEFKDALSRCQSYVREDERRPCTEEKKRVEKATRRMRLCEDKLHRAKAAHQAWEQERAKSRTKVHRLESMIESDLLVAAADLQTDIDALGKYTALKNPGGSTT